MWDVKSNTVCRFAHRPLGCDVILLLAVLVQVSWVGMDCRNVLLVSLLPTILYTTKYIKYVPLFSMTCQTVSQYILFFFLLVNSPFFNVDPFLTHPFCYWSPPPLLSFCSGIYMFSWISHTFIVSLAYFTLHS